MASGDTLYSWDMNSSAVQNTFGPPFVTRNGHRVRNFDAAEDTYMRLSGIMPQHYAGGGVKVLIHWVAATAISGDVDWTSAFEAHIIESADFDADVDSFAAAEAVVDTAPGTASGREAIAEISHTAGAQMDNLVVGLAFRIQITRLGDTGVSDDMSGAAQIKNVELREA